SATSQLSSNLWVWRISSGIVSLGWSYLFRGKRQPCQPLRRIQVTASRGIDGKRETCSNGKAMGPAVTPAGAMKATTPFDEMTNADGTIREPYLALDAWLKEQPPKALSLMSADAEGIFRRLGITFAVYGSAEGVEKLIP